LPDGFPSSHDGAGGAAAPQVLHARDGAGGATGAGGAIAPPPAGAGGSGTGGSGAGGSPGDGGQPSCDELAALYVSAVEEDKACDPASSELQCQLRVITALCGVCPNSTFVNTRTASNAARLRWDRVPCPVPTNCGPCGPVPVTGRCAPDRNGTGHCEDFFR